MRWMEDRQERVYARLYKKALGVPENGIEAPLSSACIIRRVADELEKKSWEWDLSPERHLLVDQIKMESSADLRVMADAMEQLQESHLRYCWTFWLKDWEKLLVNKDKALEVLDEGFSDRGYSIWETPHGQLQSMLDSLAAMREIHEQRSHNNPLENVDMGWLDEL